MLADEQMVNAARDHDLELDDVSLLLLDLENHLARLLARLLRPRDRDVLALRRQFDAHAALVPDPTNRRAGFADDELVELAVDVELDLVRRGLERLGLAQDLRCACVHVLLVAAHSDDVRARSVDIGDVYRHLRSKFIAY